MRDSMGHFHSTLFSKTTSLCTQDSDIRDTPTRRSLLLFGRFFLLALALALTIAAVAIRRGNDDRRSLVTTAAHWAPPGASATAATRTFLLLLVVILATGSTTEQGEDFPVKDLAKACPQSQKQNCQLQDPRDCLFGDGPILCDKHDKEADCNRQHSYGKAECIAYRVPSIVQHEFLANCRDNFDLDGVKRVGCLFHNLADTIEDFLLLAKEFLLILIHSIGIVMCQGIINDVHKHGKQACLFGAFCTS
jgi:hypothetical protein